MKGKVYTSKNKVKLTEGVKQSKKCSGKEKIIIIKRKKKRRKHTIQQKQASRKLIHRVI